MDMTDVASFNSLTGVEVSVRRLFAGRPVSGRPVSPNVGHFFQANNNNNTTTKLY